MAPQPQLTAVDPLPVIRTGSMPEDHQNPDAGIVKSQPPKSLSEMHAIRLIFSKLLQLQFAIGERLIAFICQITVFMRSIT